MWWWLAVLCGGEGGGGKPGPGFLLILPWCNAYFIPYLSIHSAAYLMAIPSQADLVGFSPYHLFLFFPLLNDSHQSFLVVY